VLHGFVRLVLVERAVIMMMVWLLFQMQGSVRKAFRVIRYQAALRHGECVPQQGYDEQNSGRRFAHGGNLSETRRGVEPEGPAGALKKPWLLVQYTTM